MKKVLVIGWKDLLVLARDRAAWIMMLAAPLVLTVAMGFVSGSFSDRDGGGPVRVPVVLVNLDQGELGRALREAMAKDGGDLLTVMAMRETAAARQWVDNDEAAAAVIVPPTFSTDVLGAAAAPVPVELYANPGRPISAGIVESFVRAFVEQYDTALVTGQVAAGGLVASGRISPEQATAVAERVAAAPDQGRPAELITISRNVTTTGDEAGFDPLAYFAIGMAVFFLMYTVTVGGRSILSERDEGTLTRMLIAPSSTAQVLGGKVLGVFLGGLAQVAILIVATGLLFDLDWGRPEGVAILVVAVVAAATGWGMLLAAAAKTPGQVSSLGTAIMLIFGILGGTFISTDGFGDLLRTLGRITPHAWALDGFASLSTGGGLETVTTPAMALLAMAALLFGAAIMVFRRRWATVW